MGYSDKETKEQNGAMPDDDSDDKEMKRFAVSHSISLKKRYWMLDSIWKLKYGVARRRYNSHNKKKRREML